MTKRLAAKASARWGVETAIAMPDHYLNRADQSRWLHRQVAAQVLPFPIAQRTNKADFDVVQRSRIDDLRTWLQTHATHAGSDWVDNGAVLELLDHYVAGRFDRWYFGAVWLLPLMTRAIATIPPE